MKESTFKFGLRINMTDHADISKRVAELLMKITGVRKVDFTVQKPFVTLLVTTTFQDGKEAKKVHRKIMTSLIAQKDISVASAESNLTEVFG